MNANTHTHTHTYTHTHWHKHTHTHTLAHAHTRSPFERAGLRPCCVVLLQGLGCSKTISCAGGAISLALITRKSIANPGTRYNARGLNDIAGAGNELESEQVR